MRVEFPNIGDESLGHPPLCRPGGCKEKDGLPEQDVHGGAETNRGELLRWNLQEGQAAGKVLRHQTTLKLPTIREAYPKFVGAQNHVIDRQEISSGVDNDAGPHPLLTQDHGRRMVRPDGRLDTDNSG